MVASWSGEDESSERNNSVSVPPPSWMGVMEAELGSDCRMLRGDRLQAVAGKIIKSLEIRANRRPDTKTATVSADTATPGSVGSIYL
jgi:hypothetical protein